MVVKYDTAYLQRLIRYDPNTGELYWLPRDASVYQSVDPTLTLAQATRQMRKFNTLYAGKVCGTSKNNKHDVIRISVSTYGTNVRRNKLNIIWQVATGTVPDGLIILRDWEKPSTPDNVLCCSTHVKSIFDNPCRGIYQTFRSNTFYWHIVDSPSGIREQQNGFRSMQEARLARDVRLKELGLWSITTLDDVLNG